MNLLRQNFLLHLSVYELESVLPAFVHPTYSLFTLYIWKSCPGRPRFGRWTKINVKYYWIISTFWCKRRSLNGTGSYHLTCVPHWKKKKIFRFSSSQFQYGIVDVSVVQAFLVKRNRKLLVISGYPSLLAGTKSLVHIYPLLFIFLASWVENSVLKKADKFVFRDKVRQDVKTDW